MIVCPIRYTSFFVADKAASHLNDSKALMPLPLTFSGSEGELPAQESRPLVPLPLALECDQSPWK